MNKDPRIYDNNFNYSVVKDINAINEKIENEKSSEELLKLYTQRLYRAMELNINNNKRGLRGYYPY